MSLITRNLAKYASPRCLVGRMAPLTGISRNLPRHISLHQQTMSAAAMTNPHTASTSRHFATHTPASLTRSTADEVAEDLSQMYADARDEFEIATESTEAHATYAAEDRAAARDELAKLVQAWQNVLEQGGEVAEDLKKRPIGQRIRELNAAIEALNLKDFED